MEESISDAINDSIERYNVADIDEGKKIITNSDSNDVSEKKNKNIKTKNRLLKLPFIIWILIFTCFLLLVSLVVYIVVLFVYKENYKLETDIYLKPSISSHNYSKLVFNNGLVVVLTQVHSDDKAGGAIAFETGYLDPKYEPGLSRFAFMTLRHNDRNSSKYLDEYIGNLNQVSEEFYSGTYFTLINSGFQNYLKNFSKCTYVNESVYTRDMMRRTVRSPRMGTSSIFNNSNEREKHLIEYLVYNIIGKDGKDLWRQTIDENEMLRRLNDSDEEVLKIINIMKSFYNPKKIKLIFASHYKMTLMKRYVLRYIKELTKEEDNQEKPKENEEELYPNLTTNKIIYFQIARNQSNFIKIHYYVKSNTNSNLTQLYLDSGYFNYLKYILDETHNESLYYELTHPQEGNDLNIKSLSCNFEVVLKRYIRFTIEIKLNEYSYRHIKEIIERVYNYMEKIKAHIDNIKTDDKRMEELNYIVDQNFTFSEDVHEGEYYKNKAKDLFYRDLNDYYLKETWVPPDFNTKFERLQYYVNQLKVNNSVVMIGISQYNIDKYNINNTQYEESFIFNQIKNTIRKPNIYYTINDLSRLNLKIIEKAHGLYEHSNEYISIYNKDNGVQRDESENSTEYEPLEQKGDNPLVEFYLNKSTKFLIPKVYINLYFCHPFIRPNHTEHTSETDNLFFHMMIYISYLQREINMVLSDAIRAGNTFKLGFSENYFYLDIFAYSDQVEKILNIIKEKVISNKKNIIDEKNFVIYRDYAIEDLLNFDNVDIKEKLKLKYFKFLTENNQTFPPIYDYYAFNKSNFETMTLNQKNNYLEYLNAPIIKGFILGYYEKDAAQKLYDSFVYNYTSNFRPIFERANYARYNEINPMGFFQDCLNRPEKKEKRIIDNANQILNNRAYSFMLFSDYTFDNRIAVEVLVKIMQERDIRITSANQKSIYVRFSFPNNGNFDTQKVKEHILQNITDKEKVYNQHVDVVGDRFYYLVKNVKDEFSKHPYSMRENALDYTYSYLYKPDSNNNYVINNNDYKSFVDIIKNIFEKNQGFCEFFYNKAKYGK